MIIICKDHRNEFSGQENSKSQAPLRPLSGFLKLINLNDKVGQTLFRPIKLTNPSYKGQRSFGITAILYTYQACKPYSGQLNPPETRTNSQPTFGVWEHPPLKVIKISPIDQKICIPLSCTIKWQLSLEMV